MTVGQRIAQRRRELGLSQEALGERLGVSRQAIYKWESDAALPEIEKLVNLSREFSVSIDWLLGREDEDREPQELTPEQLRMVEEIVGRYLAARPGPVPTPEPRPDPEADSETGAAGVRWLKRWGLAWVWLAAIVVIIIVILNLFDRLDQVRRNYDSLQTYIQQINQSINYQINSITDRVETILESQNRLTAEQSAQVASTNYQDDTVTIEARAVPRTYVEGMTAEFILASGGETTVVPAREGPDHAFTARLTGPLTDEITVSAAFLTEGQRETQVVERFTGLYKSSWPSVWMSTGAIGFGGEEHRPHVSGTNVSISGWGAEREMASIRVGAFRDGTLLAWFTETDHESDGERYFWPEEEIPAEPDVCYTLAAVLTDEYGHEWVKVGDTAMLSGDQTHYGVRGPDASELIY